MYLRPFYVKGYEIMRYYNEFKDRNNNAYTIELSVGNAVGNREFRTSGSPIEIKWNSDNKNIYSPLRKSNATIFILGDNATDLKEELYTGERKGIAVELKKGNTVVWQGWVNPNNYDSDYRGEHDELQLEASDAISCMADIPYRVQIRGIKSVKDILLKCINDVAPTNSSSYLYVADTLSIDGMDSGSFISNIFIPESLFFDDKEEGQTDDDVAWKLSDVVESICLWLNMIFVQFGTNYYLLDLDALKAGNNRFTKMYLLNGTEQSVTLSEVEQITSESYGGSDNSISKEGLFNKVKVRDNFRTFDSVIPSLYNKLTNITKDEDATLQNSQHISDGMYGEITTSELGEDGRSQGNMITLIDRVFDMQSLSYKDYNFVAAKYFNNAYYILHKYDHQGNDITDSVDSLNYTDTTTMQGACIAKFDVRKLEADFLASVAGDLIAHIRTFDEWMAKNDISNLQFENYVMMMNPGSYHIENENITNYPYLESKNAEMSAFFGGENAYLIISGSYIYHEMSEPYPIPEGEVDIREGRYAIDDGDGYILAKLEWGGLYWNGTEWTNTDSTFHIPYIKIGASSGDRRADATMFKALNIPNTVSWRFGLSEQGYCIPTPDDREISGLPKITLFKPFDPNYHSVKSGANYGRHYLHTNVFLKDFDIKAVVGDPTYSDRTQKDTIYSNNTSGSSDVSDFDDIEFKVCTYDGKAPNYSSVVYRDQNGIFRYVNDVTSSAHTEPQEAHMVRRIVTQYGKPATRLKLALRGLFKPWTLFSESITDKEYFLDCATWKVADDVSNVEIRELLDEE